MYQFIKVQLERLRARSLGRSAAEIDSALGSLAKARDNLIALVERRAASVAELDAQVEEIRAAQVQLGNEQLKAERILRNLAKIGV